MSLRKSPAVAGSSQLALYLHAFGVVSFMLVWCFFPLTFELEHSGNLILGQATMYGIDISRRVGTAYRLIAGGGAAVLLVYAVLRWLDRRRRVRFHRHSELLPLSVATICLSFLRTMDCDCQTVLTLVFCFWCLRVLMISAAQHWPPLRLLGRTELFALSLANSFLLYFALLFVAGGKAPVAENPVPIFLGLTIAVCALYLMLSRVSGWSLRRTTALLLPLACVPLLSLAVLELLFFVRQAQGFFIRFRIIWTLLLLALFAVNAVFVLRGKMPEMRSMVRNAIAPAVVIGFAVLGLYHSISGQSTEMFENANQAIPLMNVFTSGKIPLLDFMSSHMFSEQWYGYLYSLIFGYKPNTEFQLYDVFNRFIFLLIVYWFLNRVFGRPLLSALFIVLFPRTAHLFFDLVFVAVVPFFFSKRLLERPSGPLFLGLFATLLGTILWRLDTGAAAVFASVFYFPMLWWSARRRFPLPAFFKGLALFVLLLLTGFAIAVLLRSPAVVFADIRMALHYFSANQAHGYQKILYEFAHQFYLQHVAMPAFAVAACIYILAQLRRRSPSSFGRDQQLLSAALMLFLLYFANFQRGLVRHGYAEATDVFLTSTYFVALGLLAAYALRSRQAAAGISALYATAFGSFFILTFFPYRITTVEAETAVRHSALHDLDGNLTRMAEGEYEGRLLMSPTVDSSYKPLKAFLDVQLRPGQTFLDFSNTPMLYQYCERESPGYFCQNLQNTVDDYLQFALLKTVDTQRAPVVVFASYPRTWRDRVDDVPNAERLPLIAEYIYSNYRPYGVLARSSIWVSRSLQVPPGAVPDTFLDRPEIINLGLLPEYTGSFYSKPGNAKDLRPVRSWMPADSLLAGDLLRLPLNSRILSERHSYLAISFRDSQAAFDPYQVEVNFIDSASKRPLLLQFERRPGASRVYMLRLSNQICWYRNATLELHITHAHEILRVSILKDLRL